MSNTMIRMYLGSLVALFFITLFFLPSAFARTAQGSTVGELEIQHANGKTANALLVNTAITGNISGMVASIQVAQTFNNDSPDWVNGRYVFPLPEDAAVDSLTIIIGERIIKGVIKEKLQAQKVFEQAKQEGKKAGLLEQHRPNLFSISLANIAPNETIVTQLTYIDKVHYEDAQFSLRLPTTLTPRYIPGIPVDLALEDNHVAINSSTGWANNTTAVKDASSITPPQMHLAKTSLVENSSTESRLKASKASNQFSLELRLNAGLTLDSITSSSHPIKTDYPNNNETVISLSNRNEPMDRDLLLHWQPTIGNAPTAALFQQQHDNANYAMLMVMPPSPNINNALPRDVTFIIDSSGSMAGTSIRQAKQSLHEALAYLSVNDRFNIIDFDSSFTPLFKHSTFATLNNLQQAHSMIDSLNADGGTEMLGALDFALNSKADEQYLRQVIFITDGSIGNETQLFQLINQKLGNARLFTVGIGSAPNSYFMSKAAKFGRGSYTYINNLNDVSNKMASLFKKINRPLLRDLKVNWQQTVEQYPARIPDLYAGEPLILLVKSDKPIQQLNVSGHLLDNAWQQSMTGHNTSQSTDNLDALWARQKVASLMDQLVIQDKPAEELKTQIINLGIKHHLVTKFTSFIAVEQKPSKPLNTAGKDKNVANLMPKGNTMPAPQTATPATLLALLGCLLLVLSRFTNSRRLMGKTSCPS